MWGCKNSCMLLLLPLLFGLTNSQIVFGNQGNNKRTQSQSQNQGGSIGFGSSPNQGGFGSRPNQGGFGSRPNQGGFGSRPNQGGFGSSQNQGGLSFGPDASRVIGNQGGTISFGNSGNTSPNLGQQSQQGKQAKKACNCVPSPNGACGRGQASIGCVIRQSGSKGVCCIDQEGVSTRVKAFGSVGAQSVSENSITAGFERGKQIFDGIVQQQQQNKRNGNFLQRKTPARAHAYFFQRSPSAVAIHKQAYLNARASSEIAKMQQLTPEAAVVSLNEISMSDRTRRPCLNDRQPNCNPRAKFRTIDGSCNNLARPNFGKSETAFIRLSPPHYEDGIMAPKSLSVVGGALPNVRDVSNVVLLDVDNPSSDMSLSVMQWAQFVDHDLTHAPFPDMDGEAIECCRNGRRVNNQPDECFPIEIPFDDGFYVPQGQRCINFVRSMLALRPNCAFGPAEQINALTHWLDGSMVYGSTEEEARKVREGPNSPFLAVSNGNLPPTDPNMDCEARAGKPCFVAGDSRVNEQPGLTVMHTLFVREHNRIARALLNKRLSPEETFEEARRIVIAQIQHITYNEWLPIILGAVYGRRGIGARTRYNPNINPGMFNEFATASFRFGHSLVQGIFELRDSRGTVSTVQLRNVFNNPGLLQGNPELLNSFVRALTQQQMQDLDNFITEDLSNHLFRVTGNNFGMDLMSLNIQRGREHGIPDYNTMRGILGVGRANDFFGLLGTTRADLIDRLQSAYRTVDDIDLFPGGMTESRVQGGLLGETFANLNALQFRNIRDGDRFFYDVQGQPGSFTPEQIRSIESTSLAKIYCDNSNPVNSQGVKVMQRQAFLMTGARYPQNPLVPCDSIPGVDLRLF